MDDIWRTKKPTKSGKDQGEVCCWNSIPMADVQPDTNVIWPENTEVTWCYSDQSRTTRVKELFPLLDKAMSEAASNAEASQVDGGQSQGDARALVSPRRSPLRSKRASPAIDELEDDDVTVVKPHDI